VIVATSEEFTDFAYISLAKDELVLETRANNGQYLDYRLDTSNFDMESREHNGYDI